MSPKRRVVRVYRKYFFLAIVHKVLGDMMTIRDLLSPVCVYLRTGTSVQVHTEIVNQLIDMYTLITSGAKGNVPANSRLVPFPAWVVTVPQAMICVNHVNKIHNCLWFQHHCQCQISCVISLNLLAREAKKKLTFENCLLCLHPYVSICYSG
jgi:hypothetical protein